LIVLGFVSSSSALFHFLIKCWRVVIPFPFADFQMGAEELMDLDGESAVARSAGIPARFDQ